MALQRTGSWSPLCINEEQFISKPIPIKRLFILYIIDKFVGESGQSKPCRHDSLDSIIRREAAIHAVALLVEQVPDLTPHLAYLFPVLMARGVPAGSLYDPGLELFVHDLDEHEAYKRCGIVT